MSKTLKPGTTIEWVSRHLDLSIPETLEKAKAEGIKLGVDSLYTARSTLRKKYGFKGAKLSTAGKKRAPKAGTTKTAFVVEHVNQPDEKILKKAKAQGLEISKHDLQKIRWTLKNGKKKKGKAPSPSTKSDMPAKESQLRRLFFELGFDVVTKIYNEFSSLHGQMR